MAEGFVANWGNDLNDGLSWERAKKSIQGGIDAGLTPIYISGYYDSLFNAGNRTMYGVNFNYASSVNAINSGNTLTAYNFNISKTYSVSMHRVNYFDSVIYECGLVSGSDNRIITNTIIAKCTTVTLLNVTWGHNSTFHDFTNPVSIRNIGLAYVPEYNNHIFSNIDISVTGIYFSVLTYSLFINVQFQFTGGGLGTDENTYEYPIGLNDVDKIQNLRDRMAAVYGGTPSDYLEGCQYYSGPVTDILVDPDAGNFHLVNSPTNPALHMSYDGKWIGAKPPAAATFNIADAVKTNIDATGNIVDQAQDAQAEWNTIQDAGKVIEITDISAIAEIAYRNGLSINTNAYVGADIAAGSNVLTAGKQYQVIDALDTSGTVVLDDSSGTILFAFKTFTAVDEGAGVGLGFTSVDGLTLREIDINKYDERIEVVSSTTDATLSTATAIKLLVHDTPAVNVDANNEPTYGNGDELFDELTAVPFQTRYLKINAVIKANQLYAR